MRAGQLRTRIQIDAPTAARDDVGQPTPGGWAPFATLSADARVPTGLGSIRADADRATVRISFRVRFRADLKAGMRVSTALTTYLVQAVFHDESRRQWTDLVCEAQK